MRTLHARIVSEFLGTAFLVAAVVGSGIMGDRLAGGNIAIALLAGYLYAATRNVVWRPGWLKKFVLGEKKSTHSTMY